MKESFSLKDHLFNETKVRYLATQIATVYDDFDPEDFLREVMSRLTTLELKDRIRWIATVLIHYLPSDYESAVAILIASLPPPLDPHKTDDDFGDFIWAPYGEFVATNGCTEAYLACSLQALREITKRFSMEDAIRSFIRTFPNETLVVLNDWVSDDNYHVRRLVSEGTRPLLPWSGRVPLVSTDTIPLLTSLHSDPARYVTRSVANHLNDIAKKEPAVVIETLRQWQKIGKQDARELTWMTKHALRTLIKQGHVATLTLLGYDSTDYSVQSFVVTDTELRAGEVLSFETTISATADTNLLIDYVIHFVKKNGTTVPKVFKWKMVSLKEGSVLKLTKKHRLKADATTFTLYSGEHKVEVQINGQSASEQNFILRT